MSVEVPTISGRAKIKIPAGTQSGKVLKLKNKGLPSVEAYGKGDELIYISVYTPKNLSKEEQNTLEKLRDSENFKPQESKSEKGFFQKLFTKSTAEKLEVKIAVPLMSFNELDS